MFSCFGVQVCNDTRTFFSKNGWTPEEVRGFEAVSKIEMNIFDGRLPLYKQRLSNSLDRHP